MPRRYAREIRVFAGTECASVQGTIDFQGRDLLLGPSLLACVASLFT